MLDIDGVLHPGQSGTLIYLPLLETWLLALGAGMKFLRSLLCLFGIHAPQSTPIYSSWDGTQVNERRCARCGKVLGHILN